MATWTTKVDGVDKVMAAHINALQTEKLDRDGAIPLTGNWAAGAFDIQALSFSVGVNKLTTAEFAHLDGQDQAVKTTSSPTFVTNTLTGSLILSADQVAGGITGIFEGTTELIRTFRPLTADGYNLFIQRAGNVTLSPGGGAVTLASRNTGIGYLSLGQLTTGYDNVCMGLHAGGYLTTGHENTHLGSFGGMGAVAGSSASFNVSVGNSAFQAATTAAYCVALGVQALQLALSTTQSVAVGVRAMMKNTTGVGVTAIGYQALQEGNNNYSIAIGQGAGFWETGDGALMIDALGPRASEADARLKSIIYGIMAGAPADQYLTFNANVILSLAECVIAANDAGAAAVGVLVGGLYRTNADPSVLCIRSA